MARKSVNILAFDTAFSYCTVGLLHDKQVDVIDQLAPMQQSNLILPLIDKLLKSHTLSLSELDVICYGGGPGSFTGVRIAESVAKGIGYAINKPVMPVSSLALLAQSAWINKGWEKIIVCVDARMGQVYWAEYAVNKNRGVVEINGVFHTYLLDEIPIVNHSDWYGVGDAFRIHQDVLANATGIDQTRIDSECNPSAKALLLLAKAEMIGFFE